MIDKIKIFVSGSTGMVGRNVVENLDKTLYEVITTTSKELNLLDYNRVKNFIEDKKPDFIIHCAGKVGGIQANIKDSYNYYTDNVLMGINLIKSAKEAGVKNFLNLSSSCSYPYNAPNPLKEDYVFAGKLEPTNEGYAIAKASILKMCQFISRQFPDYHYKTLVPCNLYGKWDKFSEKNSHMIPAVIKKIHYAKVNNLPEVVIWGKGIVRREAMYAGDLARIINEAIGNFEKLPEVMNVGPGFDYSIKEFYEIIGKVIGYKGTFVHDESKPEGMNQKLMDITLLKQFGTLPRISLEEGIKLTYDYYLKEEAEKCVMN